MLIAVPLLAAALCPFPEAAAQGNTTALDPSVLHDQRLGTRAGTGSGARGGARTDAAGASWLPDLARERAVLRAFRDDGRLADALIHVRSLDGEVVLWGEVADAGEAELAASLARSVDGVVAVRNRVRTSS